MTTINRSAIVPYTPAEMFNLVNAIEDYQVFLPWCDSSEVLSRNDDEVKATLVVGAAGIQKSFTTLNRLQKDKMIELRLVDGPFKRLEGFWRFDAMGEGGCKVSLDLEFEFAAGLLSFAFGPVFEQMAGSLVDAFAKRAVDVYGQAVMHADKDDA